MNTRRDIIYFLLIVAFSLAVAVGMALRNAKTIPPAQGDLWQKLAACPIHTSYVKGSYRIAYTPEMKALENTKIRIDGYIMPLESTRESNHFLLSIRSSGCPYCPPAAPNQMVEVFTNTPQQWNESLTTFEGTLKLAPPENDNGIFFTLHDASPAPAITATRPLDHHPFTELTGTGYVATREVTLAHWHNTPLLVIFWRSDCAPCMRELALIPALAKRYPRLPIALVSLQDATLTRAHLPQLPENVHILLGKDEPRTLLAAFGNDKILALPYSVMRHANGTLCSTHHGILAPDTLKQWLKAC
jgi:hypothetical protein